MTKDPAMRRMATRLAPAMLVLSGCTQGGLDPRGAEANRIFGVFSALVVAGAIVAVVVLALWWRGAARPGPHEDDDVRTERAPDTVLQRRFVIGGGIVMPAVVLTIFFGVQIASTVAQPQGDGDVVIEVTGHQYWWEVAYQATDAAGPFETANQIHVPTGTPITMVLRSDDVIHSFWVPQLAGKLDLVPGRENRFTFSVDEPGTYPGYCAEYCGLQHTWMKFEVVAMEPDAFQAWARDHAAAAPEPSTDLTARGRGVFEGQSCVGCHTIRGVAEKGEVGPELTHLATRSEIGAGILPLTEDNLRAWIVNPQTIKPGVQMPPQELDREELDALVAYLLSLE